MKQLAFTICSLPHTTRDWFKIRTPPMSPFRQHFGEEGRVMSESIPSQLCSGGTAWGRRHLHASMCVIPPCWLSSSRLHSGADPLLKAWDSLTPAWLPERACPRLAGTPWPLWSWQGPGLIRSFRGGCEHRLCFSTGRPGKAQCAASLIHRHPFR